MQVIEFPTRASVVGMMPWLRERAIKHEKDKEWAESISIWRRILRLTGSEPISSAEAHFHLGLLNERMGEMTKSIFHLGCAVRLRPNSAKYHQGFGRAFLELHHFRLAKSHFEEAIRLDPKNDCHWRHYAWALFQAGEVDRAIEVAQKARALNLKSERCLWLLVHLLTEKRKWKEAAQYLFEWKKLQPESAKFQTCLEWSKKKYALTLQGAVHQYLRKRISCDGQPFNIRHLRSAENEWLKFSNQHDDFAHKRANVRLVRIWAGAAAIVGLSQSQPDSRSLTFEQFAKRFDVKAYELEAAVRMMTTPDLGRRLAPYEN